ncbi:putative 1-phosphatidylinositol-3-phosphate 5-kinase FAB1D [Telopea speciosissima]|uniref:putative 1-phosphatidylinositol-3-phosphate 5-kinase FAB1D n=1 Tax=Telopea speciosissima TaxID=54955 RepID=UPI001CC4143C|nr:putative 1-phosphatidylinositol-3-phosphate 5-kinase FAB1D [Telopea speciosissima]
MYKMCHVSGEELTNLDSGVEDMENKVVNSLGMDNGNPTHYCKFRNEKNVKDSSMANELSSYEIRVISPTISISRTDSLVSTCSEFSVDTNMNGREEGDAGASQDNPYLRLTKNAEKSSFPITSNGIDEPSTTMVENHEGSNNNSNTCSLDQGTTKDVKIFIVADAGTERIEDVSEGSSQSFTVSEEGNELSRCVDIESDERIWEPPEPEDLEDDVEGSVANNDDDDECYGTKWSQPTSLRSFSKEGSGSFRFKEERKKALIEVMNGDFKDFVKRLLTSEGINLSGDPGESWVDIVTSLSWEAASLVKPESIEAKTVEPECFVKVKCLATGSRSQSQVIKGLVFKKHAAHKHMPTSYRNPKLLLIQGMLGHTSSGLSSFNSMEQETDNLKSFIEMLEMCHPNVVLVEKSVPRDVQESLLARGITLVFDMKLQRLERIACYTGSQVVSCTDNLMNLKLKQCDSFYFEKFVEEYGSYGEGGKKPRNTLMILEGCPRPLGCTILLKGAPSDELKKIKCVVQCAVLAAYHLILETSFRVDQSAMFPVFHYNGLANGCMTNQQAIVGSEDCEAKISLPCMTNGPLIGEFRENLVDGRLPTDSQLVLRGDDTSSVSSPSIIMYNNSIGENALTSHTKSDNSDVHHPEASYEPYTPTILPGPFSSSLSASLKKVIGDGFPHVSSTSYLSIPTYFGLKEREQDSQDVTILPVVTSPEQLDFCQMEEKGSANEVKPLDAEKAESLSACYEAALVQTKNGANDEQQKQQNGVITVLDGQSILFLKSSRNILKGTVCEHSHLSRINFYKSSDMSLGRFLRDNILNQMNQCSICGAPPENHVFCYAHHNGKLTVRVRQLSGGLHLRGETEGKLWMWSRCLKCKPEKGILKPTRRVVISTASRRLSLGKFLELCFSNDSAPNRLSSCGHSLHNDSLFFYGLGSMVAMFRYSSVDIYAAFMPPQILEFNNPIGQEWLEKVAEDVLRKGGALFMEVTNLLQKIRSGFSSSLSNTSLNLGGSVKDLSEVEEMLRQEKFDFQELIQKALDKDVNLGQAAHKLLSLNCLLSELLLESYVWDQRLRSLTLPSRVVNGCTSDKIVCDEQQTLQRDDISGERMMEKNASPCVGEGLDDSAVACIAPVNNKVCSDYNNTINYGSNLETKLETKFEESYTEEHEIPVAEAPDSEPLSEGLVYGSGIQNYKLNRSINIEGNGTPADGSLNPVSSTSNDLNASTAGSKSNNSSIGPSYSSFALPSAGDNPQKLNSPIADHLQVDQTIPVKSDLLRHSESAPNMVLNGTTMGEIPAKSGFRSLSENSGLSYLADSDHWVWNPFSETRKAFRKDIHRGNSQKFGFINNYTPECLSSVQELITQEGFRCQIPLGTDDNIVSVYEGELTSIIAYSLALLHDRRSSAEDLAEETKKEKGEAGKIIENAHSLVSEVSVTSTFWSSTSSLDLEGFNRSVSAEESYNPSSDGLNFVDPLSSSEGLHPEIPVGVGKLPGKGKYSVVCLCANQFRSLRRRCCPCELDYIASLSRCKNWDAKGGKSKSFFAKTLDDRFIVKEIKKTEFDSFLKFAPDYFRYMNQSFSSGSQTCLAKVLGIYQVIIRQPKSGKELKHHLMVMENLTFGRNITRLYDLKGTLHSRHTPAADASGKVLLDQNFVDDMIISPLYVSGETKHLLQRAIWNDTSFLTSINVMDYSLLVGVDTERRELVCGIIDYLRQYTWDKHLETWVKASLVVPKNVTPTVISPKEYKKRFRKFMTMRFLSVPYHWTPHQPVCSGKVSVNKNNDSSQLRNAEQGGIK